MSWSVSESNLNTAALNRREDQSSQHDARLSNRFLQNRLSLQSLFSKCPLSIRLSRAVTTGLLVLGLVVSFSVSHTCPASAQNDQGKIDKARKLMQKGQVHFEAGEFSEAAKDFEAAYSVLSHTAFIYNAGLAWEKAGERGRAAAAFERYLKLEPNARDSDEVRGRIVRLRNLNVTDISTASAENTLVGIHYHRS